MLFAFTPVVLKTFDYVLPCSAIGKSLAQIFHRFASFGAQCVVRGALFFSYFTIFRTFVQFVSIRAIRAISIIIKSPRKSASFLRKLIFQVGNSD